MTSGFQLVTNLFTTCCRPQVVTAPSRDTLASNRLFSNGAPATGEPALEAMHTKDMRGKVKMLPGLFTNAFNNPKLIEAALVAFAKREGKTKRSPSEPPDRGTATTAWPAETSCCQVTTPEPKSCGENSGKDKSKKKGHFFFSQKEQLQTDHLRCEHETPTNDQD